MRQAPTVLQSYHMSSRRRCVIFQLQLPNVSDSRWVLCMWSLNTPPMVLNLSRYDLQQPLSWISSHTSSETRWTASISRGAQRLAYFWHPFSLTIFEAKNCEHGGTIGGSAMQVNARLGGGPVSLMNQLVWGIDLVEEQFLASAGIPSRPYLAKRPDKYVAENSVNAKKTGILQSVDFIEVI